MDIQSILSIRGGGSTGQSEGLLVVILLLYGFTLDQNKDQQSLPKKENVKHEPERIGHLLVRIQAIELFWLNKTCKNCANYEFIEMVLMLQGKSCRN